MRRLVLLVPRQHPPSHVGVGLQRKDVAVPQPVQNTTNVTSHMLLWMYHGRYRIGRCWKSTSMLVCCRCYTTSRRPLLCFWPQIVHQVRISGAVHLTPEGAGDHISVLEKGLHGVNKAGGDDSWYSPHHESTEDFERLLRQCAVKRDLTSGRCLHSLMLIVNCEVSSFFGGCLIHMFSCCGSLLEANFVFSQMQSVSIDAWQAIIEAHTLLCHNNLAITLYFRMKSEGLLPSRCTVLCVIGSCTREHELIYGRIINDDVIRAGQSLDVAIGSRLVDMYAKCSSLAEAQKVFDNLPSRNVVTWNSLIAGYAMAGEIATVFIFLEKMKKDNFCPVGVTFLCVLKACNVLRSVESGNMICMEILKYGWDLNALVGNTLVDLYAKCGRLQEAHAVFMRLRSQDVVSWNALISGYVKVKDSASALELFWRMQKEGVNPDAYTFSCAFQACGNIKEGEQGDALHNYFIVSGFEMDTHVGSTLLYMYATLNKLEEARRVFDGFSNANSVMWGMMIAGYSQHGHHIRGLELFRRMQGVSIKPDAATFPFVLISCGNLTKINPGMVAHNEVLLRHLEAELEICNSLIDMYCKCGYLREAQRMFDYLLIRDKVTWNSLITGYAQQEDSISALRLFKRMQQENIMADKVSLLGALKCCAIAGTVFQAMQLHHNVVHDGREVDMLLGSSLVDVYAKLGCLEEARFVFTRLPFLDVVSCSAMVSGYAQQGFWFQSTHVYDLMVQKSIKPDNISFACVLKACSHIGNMNDCMLLHDEIVRVDLTSDALVGNALIDMYVKGGTLSEARYVFNALPERTLASWNTIMTGYTEHDDGFQVLELFELLQQEGVCPNKVSYLCVLKACSSLGSIVYGFFVHDHIVRNSLETDLVVSNMIIDTYGRCGGLEEAHTVFDRLINQDVVSWSALIAGYAQHRGLELAQQYLLAMQQSGMNPVSKTFTSILGACSNGGQVEDGHYHFRLMTEKYRITPSIEHCNCMIDILGRAGCLDDAKKFLHSMPLIPTIATWMSLLTSCRTFGNIEFGVLCFKQIKRLNPYNSSAYMIMSKIYADANMWAEVRKLEETRKQDFAWKKPGKACVEVSGKVYQFTAGEKVYPWVERIFLKPQFLMRMLKEKGYVPESDSMLEAELIPGSILKSEDQSL